MIERVTKFSDDRIYRYTLWRDWSADLRQGMWYTPDPHLDHYPGRHDTFVQFIGLNPSTADEVVDDPTIRRCVGFAQRWGFGAMCMTNIFAYRSTSQKIMKRYHSPVGVENNLNLAHVATHASLIVCAWGRGGDHRGRGEAVVKLIGARRMSCLRKIAGNRPGHPLYVPYSVDPIPYP